LEDFGIFGGWTNNIGNISLTEGYKVKVSKDCQLNSEGNSATLPFDIPLKTGWNIIGYPLGTESNGKTVVQQLIDRGTLIKVQNETGYSIEDLGVFGGWSNNIGNFKPGKGYKIKVSADEVLTTDYMDADGNFYKTVIIGTQIWMSENLKTTRYNDGTAIPVIIDENSDGSTNDEWRDLTTPAWCWWNDNISNKNIYGALYNWYTVSTGKLCPTGWHVPTDADWTVLENYLVANGYNFDGTTTGNKIAKSMAASTNWNNSIITGSTGNDAASNNSSGFSALPGGNRNSNGDFVYVGYGGYWWSSTEEPASDAWERILVWEWVNLYREHNSKKFGFSVRCLRDF
jgi:uncharacterized protein (TIGR02145 family)